jgi:pimeloyl-ACP methyl ester carboxylesterase
MVTETSVGVRGCNLHVRRAGAGEPLLFLHGIQGISTWPRSLDLLAEHFEVIAPDHPGFGRSDDADWIDDISDLAYFYLDTLDVLGLAEVHLVGQSIGGWTALDMAIRSSSRLKSLTLVSAAGIRVTGVPRADTFICTHDELARLLFAGNGADWHAEWSAPELGDIYDRNRIAAAKLSWQPRLFDPKLEKWLHRIDVPTHIVWGEDDAVLPPAYATALQKRIAGAHVTLLPACGHLVHLERPDLFSAGVRAFIEGTL